MFGPRATRFRIFRAGTARWSRCTSDYGCASSARVFDAKDSQGLLLFGSLFVGRRQNSKLFDHLVRPCQDFLRNRQTNLLRRVQINHKLKLGRLLHGQVGGLGAL
jgi:hypothetical protein